MNKVWVVAWREFRATVMTRAFLIGAIVVPGVSMAMIPLIIALSIGAKPTPPKGSIAVIDLSGQVGPDLRDRLSPEAIRSRQDARIQRAQEVGVPALQTPGQDQALAAASQFLPDASQLQVELLSADADPEQERDKLRGESATPRLALVVVASDAVTAAEGAPLGSYEMYVRPKLDAMIRDDIGSVTRDAIVSARLRARSLDPEQVLALTVVRQATPQEVTETGVQDSNALLNIMMPFAFMMLLMISVMVGGQSLLTSTVEEKSNRLAEVLLSALSPMQLMAGKIVGQMGVGLALIAVYGAVGTFGLASAAMMHILSWWAVAALAVYFLIAYFLVASFMAAIGAAVSDMREAQVLLTPVMLMLMIPYFLWLPISRGPDSLLSVICSLVPPISPFAMMIRLTSSSPPPAWQVILSMGLGIAAIYPALWAAGKVFRVGLLVYGKPPNFATLLRWIRAS